jgi:hypothetical protein
VEYIVEGPDGPAVGEAEAYPPRQYRRSKQFVNAPDAVEQLYRETIEAFNQNLRLFCAGGLRALIEAICAQQGVADGPKWNQDEQRYVTGKDGQPVRVRTLDGKIEGLAERALLTQAQARRFHELRFLGNRALHELDVPTESALEMALTLCEHLLDELYTMPAQADGLMRLRQPPSSGPEVRDSAGGST